MRRVALCLLTASLVGCAPPHGADLPEGSARVVEVVDGDTLVVDVGGSRETARLLGIDTPETHHPTRPVECFGAEATARLAELTPPGGVVHLERDEEPRDHYGRLLVYVRRPDDDALVNEILVAEGAAVALPVDPNHAHLTALSAAERDARARGAGLWGACGGPGVPVDPLASASEATASR